MRDAGHRTPDIGQQTSDGEKAKIIYPPPRGVDITNLLNSENLKIAIASLCHEL